MASLPQSSDAAEASGTKPPRPRMSTRNRLLFFATGWLIVLMPFLFWWNTWFGRQLSDKQIAEYLQDEKHPRHIQHALVQMGERMSRGDVRVKQWYPEAVRLAGYPVEEVRNTDAWVMGQDTSGAGFHEALLKMLGRFVADGAGECGFVAGAFWGCERAAADCRTAATGEDHGVAGGKVIDTSVAGTAIHQGGLVAKVQSDGQTVEVRSPISGRLREMRAQVGQNVAAGAEIATVDPGTEQVWEALRGLYLVGQADDIAAVLPYERELPDIPDHVRQQAVATEKAIRGREK